MNEIQSPVEALMEEALKASDAGIPPYYSDLLKRMAGALCYTYNVGGDAVLKLHAEAPEAFPLNPFGTRH